MSESNTLKSLYNIVWYGVCADSSCEPFLLTNQLGIEKVYQVNGDAVHVWSKDIEVDQDFSQLECGRAYFIQLESENGETPKANVTIENARVSEYAVNGEAGTLLISDTCGLSSDSTDDSQQDDSQQDDSQQDDSQQDDNEETQEEADVMQIEASEFLVFRLNFENKMAETSSVAISYTYNSQNSAQTAVLTFKLYNSANQEIASDSDENIFSDLAEITISSNESEQSKTLDLESNFVYENSTAQIYYLETKITNTDVNITKTTKLIILPENIAYIHDLYESSLESPRNIAKAFNPDSDTPDEKSVVVFTNITDELLSPKLGMKGIYGPLENQNTEENDNFWKGDVRIKPQNSDSWVSAGSDNKYASISSDLEIEKISDKSFQYEISMGEDKWIEDSVYKITIGVAGKSEDASDNNLYISNFVDIFVKKNYE